MRLKPRLLNLAAGVSLLLAVAIVALWMRSYVRGEGIIRSWHTSTERRSWAVESLYGSLNCYITRNHDVGGPIAPRYTYFGYTQGDLEQTNPLHWFRFPPVQFEHLGDDERVIAVAYWLLLLPTLPLPVIAIARHRRRRHRETSNLCPTCGYDLRATPDRCPECGAVPASSAV